MNRCLQALWRMEGEQKWCVVTGGRGFAARHLVVMLIHSGRFSVRVADLGPTIKLEPSEEKGLLGEALQSGRAEYVSTDLRDKAQVLKGLSILCASLEFILPALFSILILVIRLKFLLCSG